MTQERWLPIPGYEGLYSASDQGRIRSEDRVIIHSNGAPQPWSSRILKPGNTGGRRGRSRHLCVGLTGRDGRLRTRLVHQLVLLTFVGPRPPGLQSLHYDDNPLNNALSNLRYGTHSDNQRDAVRNGRHAQAAKTECIHGHRYTPENTGRDRGQRYCRQCRRDRVLARKSEGTAA